jgi:uncharacterized protein YfiM (DUF2279 family)
VGEGLPVYCLKDPSLRPGGGTDSTLSQTHLIARRPGARTVEGIGRKARLAGIIQDEVPLPQRIRRARSLPRATCSLLFVSSFVSSFVASFATSFDSAFLAPVAVRPAAAQADPWWGQDKALHFSTCFMLAGDGYATTAVMSKRDDHRLLAGLGLAAAVGGGKEVYDKATGGDASLRDLTWDVVGGATGAAISWLIDRYIF